MTNGHSFTIDENDHRFIPKRFFLSQCFVTPFIPQVALLTSLKSYTSVNGNDNARIKSVEKLVLPAKPAIDEESPLFKLTLGHMETSLGKDQKIIYY